MYRSIDVPYFLSYLGFKKSREDHRLDSSYRRLNRGFPTIHEPSLIYPYLKTIECS